MTSRKPRRKAPPRAVEVSTTIADAPQGYLVRLAMPARAWIHREAIYLVTGPNVGGGVMIRPVALDHEFVEAAIQRGTYGEAITVDASTLITEIRAR